MARVFVTGANGFIGTHLIEHLLERGDEVTGLVRATSDLRLLLPLFRKHGGRLRLVVGDLRDPGSLEPALEGVEFVYHLGAVLLGTSESEFREANVEGTRHLLEAVSRRRTERFRRFVFTSSLAAAGPSPDGTPIDESAVPRPVSWYGRSKRDAETLVRQHAARGLPVTIVRPTAVYGERERDISGGTFPIVRMGFLPRVGLREKILTFVYVGDVVRALVAAAESPNAMGKTYFLADPRSYRTRDLVTAIADAMGKRVRIPIVTPHFVLSLTALLSEWAHAFTRGRPRLTRDKVREVRHRAWVCSVDAARRDFGWVAQMSLADGMVRAVRDWEARRQEARAVREVLRDRAIKTYSLALALGVVVEGLARLGGWYEFQPWWLILVVIVAVFGGVMGSISLAAISWPAILAFVAGAAVGVGAELANDFWLHFWEFDPALFGRLPGPWIRALALGLPAGFMPILVNAMVRALYRRRLRVG